jgi:hypothetical protein
MHIDQLNYLPLSGPFFILLLGVLSVVIFLIKLGALLYAYSHMGVSSGAALLLPLGSLLGSYLCHRRAARRPDGWWCRSPRRYSDTIILVMNAQSPGLCCSNSDRA